MVDQEQPTFSRVDKQGINSGDFVAPQGGEEENMALLSGALLSWRLSSETSLFSSDCTSVSPSLCFVAPLMLYDNLSWALYAEPPALWACLSPLFSVTVYISVSLEEHFYPTCLLLQSLQPHSVCPHHILCLHLFVLWSPEVLIKNSVRLSGGSSQSMPTEHQSESSKVTGISSHRGR